MYGSTASRSQGGGELLDVVSSGGSQQRYEPSAGASRQDTNSRVPPPASRATPLLRRQPRDLRRLYYQRINVISAAIEPSWSHPRKMTVDDSFFSVDPNIRPLSPSKDVAALHRDAAHALDDPVAGCDVTPGGTQIARDGDDDDDDDELKVTRISLVKSIFNLTNTTVGAGTLALPYYVAQTGFGLGLGLLALVACLSDFALGLLMECGKITQTSSYFDVAREAYGRAGGYGMVAIACPNVCGICKKWQSIICPAPDHMLGCLSSEHDIAFQVGDSNHDFPSVLWCINGLPCHCWHAI